MNSLLSGAIAGLAATGPMTFVMKSLHRVLPREHKPLPPQQITRRLSGARSDGPRNEWDTTTHLAHYAYGAGCGAAYALAHDHLPGSPAVRGAIFGAGVWAVSYLGWLPAAGILPPATREPAERNGLMLLAHVVWGASTALAIEKRKQSS